MARAERETKGPSDPLAPLAAEAATAGVVHNEEQRVAKLLFSVRSRVADLQSQIELVETAYTGAFLPDVAEANKLATALVSGHLDTVPFDPKSLGEHGESPDQVRTYLESFEAQDPTKEYPFPSVNFPVAAILMHNGREHTVSGFSDFTPLDGYTSPSFRKELQLPMLLDPTVRTLDELAELEPGHGMQVREAYEMAAQEQGDKSASFQQPDVIRMVAVLPVGDKYATDFAPHVTIHRSSQAWDPYLLVNGEFNHSTNYLSHTALHHRDTALVNHNSRETSLRVSRPHHGSAAEHADGLIPVVPHELNALGLMLFPYEVQKKPLRDYGPSYPGYGSGLLSMGGEATRGVVGGAEIGFGQSGWGVSGKREETIYGDKILPVQGGKPVVYSVRFLTAQR